MSFEEVALLLSRVDWDLALGLAVVPFFLLCSVIYLVKGEWPWDKQYRAVSLAGLFLLLATWSAAGLSGISGAFWFFVMVGGVGAAVWWLRSQWLNWMGNLPIPGQVFKLRGVGDVEILSTHYGESPLHATTTYRGPDGMDTTISTMTFLRQGEIQVDQSLAVDPAGEYEPVSSVDQARRNRAAQLSKLSL